ncbi:carbohydrate kinase family protein [Candidatus Microgenomates bacterium]|nr:carbohydrate kinase family protein [Candidatus Microgenomates bacterium]
MSNLIVFGSARVDAFLSVPANRAEKLCEIDTHKCVIELSYGAKIPLDNVEFLVGGNGANVAIGTKRLGAESLLVAELGNGILADYAKRELTREIDTKHVTQTQGVAQGFGAVIMYEGERTILSYYPSTTPPFPDSINSYEWAYLTSVGESFEEYFEKVYAWISTAKPKLAFNPGGRQIAKGGEWLKKYLEKTEILFVNREEGEEIAGVTKTTGREKDLFSALAKLGVKQIIITDGESGSYAFDGKTYYKTGVLPVNAYERTGAGDSFASGCLSALIQGKPMNEALLWGTVNSASVIGRVGSIGGLLKKEELSVWLERAKSSGVRVETF